MSVEYVHQIQQVQTWVDWS